MTITVTLYTRPGCHLCEQVEKDLGELQADYPHKLAIIDIESDPAMLEKFALEIPVVEAGPYRLTAPISKQKLQMTLGAAADRRSQLERIDDKAYRVNTSRVETVTSGDRLSYWISRHYLALFNFLLVLYIGLPFMAPIFKKLAWNGPAELIYKLYSPLCHQWGFRSFFLFGEQPYYPHAAANVSGALTFEQVTGLTDLNDPNRLQARAYEGNPVVGYKVALCERDVAIWGSLALYGLVFAALGRRLPKMHWLVWFLLGLVPIGLDGFSQLFSQLPIAFLHNILPYRESTPFLRILTGCLFGFSTAWFMFPLIEESMADTRRLLAKKFASVKE
jgi:uncharacterized membrane protein